MRNLPLHLAVYIIFLIAFSCLLVLSLQPVSWYAALPVSGIIWMVYCIVSLFNRNPQKLSYFLSAVDNQDSTLFFSEEIRHKPTKEMHTILNRMNKHIQEVKLKNHQQEQFFSLLLEQVGTGIMVINDKGNILLANLAAKTLLDYPFLTHLEQLKRIDAKLYQAVYRLQYDHRPQYVRINSDKGLKQLSLQVTNFVSNDQSLRIVSVHDISSELESKELESWQRLIRVITHEIMNSVAPITSLSETLLRYYGTDDKRVWESVKTDEKIIVNTIKGLEVINERGAGLIRFVESYRKLARLSEPKLKIIFVKELLDHLLLLLENDADYKRIKFRLEVNPADIGMEADEAQLSQLVLNLIRNSMQALETIDDPEIGIQASYSDEDHIEIVVADNGPGIPSEIKEQIFIPFFTTRENGSGIGLSLSRQIMRNHGGSIELFTSPGSTKFVLRFQRFDIREIKEDISG